MKKGMVRDAATMAAAAKINELLHECDTILSEHGHRAEQGLYGQGLWAPALSHDILAVRGRLDRVRALVAGSPENLGA